MISKKIYFTIILAFLVSCGSSFELDNLTENESEVYDLFQNGKLTGEKAENYKECYVSLVVKLVEDDQLSEAESLIKISGELPSFFTESDLAEIYFCKALIINSDGQKEKALQFLNKSVSYTENDPQKTLLRAKALIKSAEILSEIGRLKMAGSFSKKALKILKDNISENEIYYLRNILLLSEISNRLKEGSSDTLKSLESNKYFQKLENSKDKNRGNIYASYLQLCAELALQQKNIEKAEFYTDKAQEKAELLENWRLLAKCSDFYAAKILPLKKFPAKKEKEFRYKLYLTASQYASKTDDFLLKSMMYFKLADAIYSISPNGFYEDLSADEFVESALDGFKKIGNSFQSDSNYRAFMDAMLGNYERYMDSLIKNEKYTKALYVSEMLRSWKLRNIMQSRRMEPEALLSSKGKTLVLKKTAHLKRLERRLMKIAKSSLYFNKEEVARLESQIKELNKDINLLRKKYTTYKYRMVRTDPADIDDVQKVLKDGEMIAVFYLNKNNTAYRWTLTNKKIRFKRIMLDSSIDGIVKDISAGFPGYDFNEMRFYYNTEKAYFVYNRLLKDIFESELKPEYLIIVPHKNMAQIPFDALVTEYSKTKIKYLIEENVPISITPSLTIYEMKKSGEKEVSGKSFLGYIEPDYDGYAAQLPMTIPCIRNFASNFSKSAVYMKGSALESHFKRRNFSNYKYVHVSTHGSYDSQYNREPFIMFAMKGDPYDDGYLYAGEVYRLNMPVRSVAFDACLTAVGNIDPYEGIVGFSHALSAAGAEYMLLTQWAIFVDTGRVFFDSYYKNIAAGKNVRDSYHAAKVRTMKENKHPVYWGPVVLYE